MIDQRANNSWSVYIHINKINDKKYVGITSKKPEQRWCNGNGYKNQIFYNAIQKYGWDNFEHEIIAQHLTRSEAIAFETTLILSLQTHLNKNGYNAKIYEDTVNDQPETPIYQFDIYGNFICEFNSITKAANSINGLRENITAACQKKIRTSSGYIWRFKKDIQNVDDVKKEIENDISYYYERYYPIYQFSLNYEFIKEFKNADEVFKSTNIYSCSILDVCRGIYRYAGDYIWRFKKDVPNISEFEKNPIILFQPKPSKANHVLQFNQQGILINEYNNATEASKAVGCCIQMISFACCGKSQSAKGFLWRYKKDYNGQIVTKKLPKVNGRAIVQCDLNDNFIKKFDLIADACREMNKPNNTSIRDVCCGNQKTAYGYKWYYLEDYLEKKNNTDKNVFCTKNEMVTKDKYDIKQEFYEEEEVG